MKGVVCLHQPAYLPWLGLVESMFACETFVHLDDVQFEVGGFQNRNRIKTATGPAWLGLPVTHGAFAPLADVTVSHAHRPSKMRRAVEVSYARARHFHVVMDWLDPFLRPAPGGSLMELNIECLESLARRLGAPCLFVRASALRASTGSRLENIARVLAALDARWLYTGSGMRSYTSEDEMRANGIAPVWHEFQERGFTYPQLFSNFGFVPNLSVIDMAFNCGFDVIAERLTESAKAVLQSRIGRP